MNWITYQTECCVAVECDDRLLVRYKPIDKDGVVSKILRGGGISTARQASEQALILKNK